MKKIITILTAFVAISMLSSCILVTPEDFIIKETVRETTTTETKTTQAESKENAESKTETQQTTVITQPTVKNKYSITCKNATVFTVTDWCVKKDNQVTFSNSSFNRSIPAYGEDMISNLPEGYYKVFFTFEDEYQLNPWDYQSSESVYLNQNVKYCLYTKQANYVECRSADAKPVFYLQGSDGSEIELTCK